ncbi:N-6 DNA methylase [Candidatus Pelagibacter sp.]|nr:N-6 DNA methylase [Candidatus Pelagibacter sp.]
MKITLSSIEQSLLNLLESLDQNNFIYNFLSSYDLPKSSITRLKKGNLNSSKNLDEVYWKKKIFFKRSSTALFEEDIVKFKEINDVKYLVITDFNRMYAINKINEKVIDIEFKDIAKYYDFFLSLTNIETASFKDFENTLDVKATKNLGKLYYSILADNYKNITKENLNNFFSCLVFCYFAEDTKIFRKNLFTEIIKNNSKNDGSDLKFLLNNIFTVLDTANHKRKNLPVFLNEFPYVNGKLFEIKFDLPSFSNKSRELIIENALLDWSEINPDIFGNMIQQVVRSENTDEYARHYTMPENILKTIKPLFLDAIQDEFEKSIGNEKKLNSLLDRIAKMKFFDPACGSGNFLIVTYKEIRRIEMDILKEKGSFPETLISLQNFYGIEIDDFSHEISKLSLWLAEHQMNLEFYKEFGTYINTLPLKSVGNIIHANSCNIDWRSVCPNNKEDEIYLIGNPPFFGTHKQTKEQKEDIKKIFSKDFRIYKELDYVCCWFWLGAKYIIDSKAELAFVSTNSICQGSHVEILWPNINNLKIEKHFAYRQFKWKNNAPNPATPFVIILGLRNLKKTKKKIFDGKYVSDVKYINSYLLPAEEIIIKKRSEPLSDFFKMPKGNMPYGKGLIISNIKEKNEIVKKYPSIKKYIKELIGADEFVQRKKRWCYWIKNDDLNDALTYPPIKKGIEENRLSRENSTDKGGKKLAKTPHLFRETRETIKNSIIVPLTVTEKREHFPIGFISKKVIATNLVGVIYEAEPFMFSILSSRMHFIWIETSCGGKGGGIRYSMDLGYNTFPFPQISNNTKEELSKNYFHIEEIRQKYSDRTYEELYNPDKMPNDLKEAFKNNDKMIENIYQKTEFSNDLDRLKHLLKLYLIMTNDKNKENINFDF